MPTSLPLTHLLEMLHRAFRSQMFHLQEHPQTVRNLEALERQVQELLQDRGAFTLHVTVGGFTCEGRHVDGAPHAAQFLANEMEARAIGGLTFLPGLQLEDLKLLLFVLQLRPERLAEMGGASSLLPEDGMLVPLAQERPAPGPVDLDWEEIFTAEEPAPEPLPQPQPPPAGGPACEDPLPLTVPMPLPAHIEPLPGPASMDWAASTWHLPGEAGAPSPDPDAAPTPEADPTPEAAARATTPVPIPLPVPIPFPAPPPVPQPPLTAPALALDLRSPFMEAIARTSPVAQAGPRSPWGADHRDALKRFGFAIPDFRGMAGLGARLGLDAVPPPLLRDAVRQALAGLEAFDQGNVLLGLPAFPDGEHALRRALDFIAPELLAQAIAHVHVHHQPSLFDLALLAVALMQCVHDRELSLEAIRGRLQFEGWGIEEVESFKEAVQWECQGTDTKLHLSLERNAIHEQDPHLVMTLGRQLIRGRRLDDLRNLLTQLEQELLSPVDARRRNSAEILGDLGVSLQESGVSQDIERRILQAAHQALASDRDAGVAQGSAQAVEAVLGRWLATRNGQGVHAEMLLLGRMTRPGGDLPAWKAQLVRDLLTRVASPANLALLLPTLHGEEHACTQQELHEILALMGLPAASALTGWLEFEGDPTRRARLSQALGVMGAKALPVLRECLASPQGPMVEEALRLLARAGDPSILPDLLLTLSHWDPSVRRAAAAAISSLAGPAAAAGALAEALPKAPPETQLENLILLGELGDPCAIPAVIQLLQANPSQGEEVQRVRLRAAETLGRLPAPASVNALLELFQRKGLFKTRESLALRLCAARALAGIPGREAREAMALALEAETQEDVRAVLRQSLIRN